MKLDSLTKSQVIAAIILLTAALAAWPMRTGLMHGNMVGAGPDVSTTLWTMWWFQTEWAGAAWGGESYLFNFPWGGSGAILSPFTATTWAVLEPFVGPAIAGSITTRSQVTLFGLTIVWLAKTVGLSTKAALIALLATFTQRYLFYGVGETSVVGITALPVTIGLIALINIQSFPKSRLWVLVAIACTAIQPLENPYLTPVLPGVAALMLLKKDGRRAIALTLLAGIIAMIVVGGIHQGATSLSYESTISDAYVGFGQYQWAAIEKPWARGIVQWMIAPPETIWSTATDESVLAQGREYLGISVLALTGLACLKVPRKAILWVGFGLVGVLLSTGSDWGGLPGAFAFLNAVCMRLVRALTQPTRYLILANIGLAIAAGWGFQWILNNRPKWATAVAALVVVDAFTLGGLSLKLPEMEIPVPSCVEALREESGGVLVWPWDGADHVHPDATVESRMMQVVHGQPGATIGTGSWPIQPDGTFPGHLLRRMGWTDGFSDGSGHMDLVSVANWGYRWVVADLNAPPELLGDPNTFFGEPIAVCDGASIHKMPDVDEGDASIERTDFTFTPNNGRGGQSTAGGGGTHGR